MIATPAFNRPSRAGLAAEHGLVEAMVQGAMQGQVADARVSLDAAFARSADVLFCHDAAVAEEALGRRRRHEAVWLMVHTPMPLALYMAWCWGVPEWDWREVASLPDVDRWSKWEIGILGSVDRLIVPCPEAFEELVRVEPAAGPLTDRLTYVLSGASLGGDGSPSPADRAAARRRFGLPADRSVGLFLGNNQPYRGLDCLLAAVRSMGRDVPDGLVAVAGPPSSAVGRHRRLRVLGPVSDVAALLASVDFVINVNRFSLFDLSTIEAVEAGKPLLLHASGGNNTFQRLGAGCVMVPDLEPATVAAGLSRMFAASPAEWAALGRASRRCYEQHLTLGAFWRRHAELYEEAPAAAGARRATGAPAGPGFPTRGLGALGWGSGAGQP
jgi:glycosyltransferase involved in cell wall biosynthesis